MASAKRMQLERDDTEKSIKERRDGEGGSPVLHWYHDSTWEKEAERSQTKANMELYRHLTMKCLGCWLSTQHTAVISLQVSSFSGITTFIMARMYDQL